MLLGNHSEDIVVGHPTFHSTSSLKHQMHDYAFQIISSELSQYTFCIAAYTFYSILSASWVLQQTSLLGSLELICSQHATRMGIDRLTKWIHTFLRKNSDLTHVKYTLLCIILTHWLHVIHGWLILIFKTFCPVRADAYMHLFSNLVTLCKQSMYDMLTSMEN